MSHILKKKCSKCKQYKKLSAFYNSKCFANYQYQCSSRCKKCIRVYHQKHDKEINYASQNRYYNTKRGRSIHNKINRAYYQSQIGKDRNTLIKTKSAKQFIQYKLANIVARKEWPVTIDLQFLLSLYKKQRGRCQISKMPMTHKYYDLCSISIDRIDSSIGYIKNNVQLVCRGINLAKQHFDNKAIIEFVKKIKGTI